MDLEARKSKDPKGLMSGKGLLSGSKSSSSFKGKADSRTTKEHGVLLLPKSQPLSGKLLCA